MVKTSPALEDYLKTIYAHTEWQNTPITPSALATKLGIAPSSVTEMVKKLAAQGLAVHIPYGAVELTQIGKKRALDVVRRHRLLETWLVADMGYSWDAVHDEAEVLEHVISDRLLQAIDDRLGQPRFDPHGDPIPDADGIVNLPPAIQLSELRNTTRVAGTNSEGAAVESSTVEGVSEYIVLRVSDKNPAVLRDLARQNIRPGMHVTLNTAVGGFTVTLVDGNTVQLSSDAADAIWLTRKSHGDNPA